MKCQLLQETDVPVPENNVKLTLPGTFLEVVTATRNHFHQLGFLTSTPVGPNQQGAYQFLVGMNDWSRAIALHPEDPRGLVYLLKDNGKELDNVQVVQPALPIWLADFPDADRARYHLLPREHRNRRLMMPEEVLGYAI